MLRGFYISGSGMVSSQTEVNQIGNNLANTNTTGYKEDQNVFKAYPQQELHRTNDNKQELPIGVLDSRPYIGTLSTGTVSDGTYTNFTQGSFEKTGNPLDFALKGNGFFSVRLSDGKRAFTRSGDFKVNAENQLVTSRGNPVMGQNGPIQLPEELQNINVTDSGQILSNNGALQGTLRVVQFDNPQKLRKRGDTMFLQGENNPISEETERVTVHNQMLETSNNEPIQSLTSMVRASRRYQMNQRALKRQDSMLEQAIRQVGR
jgi:flagellar basal-body rod protein FlgF